MSALKRPLYAKELAMSEFDREDMANVGEVATFLIMRGVISPLNMYALALAALLLCCPTQSRAAAQSALSDCRNAVRPHAHVAARLVLRDVPVHDDLSERPPSEPDLDQKGHPPKDSDQNAALRPIGGRPLGAKIAFAVLGGAAAWLFVERGISRLLERKRGAPLNFASAALIYGGIAYVWFGRGY